MSTAVSKIEKACVSAKDKMESLGIEEQLVSEIEWCLGSFASDQNPAGLYEKGEAALKALESFKKENPKKVTKKLLDDLQKALKAK
jgi:hypothetical protein